MLTFKQAIAKCFNTDACNYNIFMHTLANLYFGVLSIYSLVLKSD